MTTPKDLNKKEIWFRKDLPSFMKNTQPDLNIIREILAFQIHDVGYTDLKGQDKMSVDQATEALNHLLIQARIDELDNHVRLMNGWHPGDWEESIKARIKDLMKELKNE
jgi:hypothetical protein